LEETIIDTGLRSNNDADATAMALSILVNGWNQSADQDPALQYMEKAQARSSEKRQSLASIIAADLNDITRAVDEVDQASVRLLAIQPLPSSLTTEIATLEKAMNATRKATQLASRAVLTAYQGDAIPQQITDSKQQLEKRFALLVEHADALAAIKHGSAVGNEPVS